MVEVVTLTSTLTDTGEYRVATVLFSDVVDELHERHGLADTGAAEQSNLTALGDRHDQVDDLDAGFEQARWSLPALRRTARAVDRHRGFSANVAGIVDRVTEDVHDAAQCLLADRHCE